LTSYLLNKLSFCWLILLLAVQAAWPLPVSGWYINIMCWFTISSQPMCAYSEYYMHNYAGMAQVADNSSVCLIAAGRGAFFLHQQAPPTIRRYAVLCYSLAPADNAVGYAPGGGRC